MKKAIGLSLAMVFIAAGCQTPRQKLAATRITFNGVVDTLANLREQGGFTKDEAANVSAMIQAGSQALDRWQAQLELGLKPDTLIEAVDYVLRELVAARIKAEKERP